MTFKMINALLVLVLAGLCKVWGIELRMERIQGILHDQLQCGVVSTKMDKVLFSILEITITDFSDPLNKVKLASSSALQTDLYIENENDGSMKVTGGVSRYQAKLDIRFSKERNLELGSFLCELTFMRQSGFIDKIYSAVKPDLSDVSNLTNNSELILAVQVNELRNQFADTVNVLTNRTAGIEESLVQLIDRIQATDLPSSNTTCLPDTSLQVNQNSWSKMANDTNDLKEGIDLVIETINGQRDQTQELSDSVNTLKMRTQSNEDTLAKLMPQMEAIDAKLTSMTTKLDKILEERHTEKWEAKFKDFTREQVSEREKLNQTLVDEQRKNEEMAQNLKTLKEDAVNAREHFDQNGWSQFREEVESFLQEAKNSFSNIQSEIHSTKTRQDELMQLMNVLKGERNKTNFNIFQELNNTETQQDLFIQSLQALVLETNLNIQENISTCINHTLNALIECLYPKWPEGTYGLLQTQNQCPGEMDWEYGYIQIHTESRGINYDSVSGAPHMNLNTKLSIDGDRFMNLSVCVITKSHPCPAWPAGSYCIMRRGGTCPSGFNSGYIDIDTEDINNKDTWGGYYVDEYNTDTVYLYFCCRSDCSPSTPIVLPTQYPFYLFRYQGSCQNVVGMSVTGEYIIIDSENNDNLDSYGNSYHPDGSLDNVRLELCYYS